MTLIEEGQIQIHTENIFPIIKKAVYSGHEVFLRELISNSLDAITKRRMAAISGDCIEGEEGTINITIDRESKTIKISDNGIGMESEEVKKYINQVAFSSAEEFLQKYQKDNDSIIGHFGLGFYSSFMVSREVEIITKSAKESSSAVRWKCDGSPKFLLEGTDKEEIGTDIILHIMDEEIEYIEPSRIRSLITKYCDFMPVEIKLEGETINKKTPLWKKDPKKISDQEYIDLYNYLYPYQGDPLLWIHLNTDYPYNLQGILYFPKQAGRADWEKGEIKLFCNQVFVSDSIKEIVPHYLLPLRGAIDSPDIPLNVSRSALQTDRRVISIGNFISKKVADKLKSLKDDNSVQYADIWESISPFIKIGAMEDPKFSDQVEDLILFATTGINENLGDQDGIISTDIKKFTTLKEYLNRLDSSTSNKQVIYCTDEISQHGALNIWKSQGAEILFAETVIDTQFIPWLESKYEDVKFQRVDSDLSNTIKESTSEIKDIDGKSSSEEIRDVIKKALDNEKITIQVQGLLGDDSPAGMILLPEQMRRINDMGALMEQRLPGLPDHHVFLINTNHELVKGLLKIKTGSVLVGAGTTSPSDDLAKEIAIHIYEMALLGVGGIEASEINGFQARCASLMGKLIQKTL